MELTQEICCAIFLCLLTTAQICASTSVERNYQDEQISSVIRLPATVREKNVETEPEYTLLNSEVSSEILNRSAGDDPLSSESAVINRFASAPDTRDQYSASAYNPEVIPGNNYSAADDDPPGPEDHVIPFSEHEEPRDISTKPKYRAPGEWARPSPEKNIPLDFVPTKHYAQVRGTHTVKRLPKEEAIKSAETTEEKENAPRLREVVTNSKVNTVYTEEGYEDAAYDHAGHIRDADFHEGFAKKVHEEIDGKHDSHNGKYKKKKTEQSKKGGKKLDTSEFNNYDDDYSDHLGDSLKVKEELPVSKTGRNVDAEDVRDLWGEPDVNPKAVVLNGVEKLEEDLKREAAEVERRSEIHDSVKLHETEDDSGQSYSETGTKLDNHRRKYDHRNADDRSIIVKPTERNLSFRRKRPDKIYRNGKTSGTGIKGSKGPEEYKNAYETTPIPFGAYVAPTTMKFYEKTAELNRVSPLYSTDIPGFSQNNRKEAASHHVPESTEQYTDEDSTTVNYGQLFWNYFKARGSEQGTIPESIRIQETTTLGPEIEGNTPLAIATINGHGPYLLVANEQVTTEPSALITLRSYDSQKLPPTSKKIVHNDSEKLQPEAKQDENNGLIDAPKFAPYEKFQPQTTFFDSYQAWATEPAFSANNFEDVAYSSTITNSVTVHPKNDSKTQPEYSDNPFSSPLVRDAYAGLVHRNKSRYKVLVRHEPKKHHKYHKAGIKAKQNTMGDNLPKKNESRKLQDSSETRDKLNDNTFYENPSEKVVYKNVNLVGNQPNREYRKMLDYIKGQRSSGKQGNALLSDDGESSLEDFTIMRPPPIPQQTDEVTYSGFLPHHPRGKPAIVERPSVSIESETPREQNTKNLPASFDQHRVRAHKLVALPLIPITRPSIHQPLGLIHKRTLIPPTELLPPPLPSFQMGHLKYNVDGLNEHYVLENDHSKQQKKYQAANGPMKKFIPITFDLPWNIDAGKRRKRSIDIESEDKVIAPSTIDHEKETGLPTNDRDAKNDITTIRSTGKRRRNFTSEKANNVDNSQIISSFESKRIARKLNDPPTIASNNNQSHFRNNKIEGGVEAFSEENVTKLEVPKTENTNETQNPSTVSKMKDSIKRVVARRAPPLASKSRKHRPRKTEDELLNESPKITEDVINEELRTRFDEDGNKKKIDDEESGHVEVEVPEFDFVEELVEGKNKETVTHSSTEASVDTKKYPFYKSRKIPNTTAMKYIVNPEIIPKKTFGGMEFYESRDAYKQCSEVEPNLDEVLPEEEEPVGNRGPEENSPRLQGLGNKIDCYKAKFFDENPFDNPLFFEKRVDEPTPPSELDPGKFKSRILQFPKEKDDYIVQMISKRPESESSLQQSKYANGPYPQTFQLDYRYGPRDKNKKNGYFHSVRQSVATRPVKRQKSKNQRLNTKSIFITTETPTYLTFTPYQNLVYEDVMGNIKNSDHSYKILTKPTRSSTMDAQRVTVNTKTSNSAPNLEREKDTGVALVDITERPRIYSSSIGSHHPLPYLPSSTQSKFHKRTPSYRPSNAQTFPSHTRVVGRLKRIVLQKRSISRDGGENVTNKEKHSIKRRSINDSSQEEKLESEIKTLTKETEQSSPQTTSDNSSTTTKPTHGKRPEKMQNTANQTTTNVNNEPKSESSQRVVYTIKDRIKHSKPRETVTRVGKFTAGETSLDEETRRREPKYNKIANKKSRTNSTRFTNPNNEFDATADAISSVADAIPVTSATSTLIERKQLPDSSGQNFTRRKKKANNVTTESLESEIAVTPSIGNDDLIKTEPTNTSPRTFNAYDVHEHVKEDVPITTLRSVPTTSDEFARLKAYLESEPPGYAEAFPEESNKELKVNESNESKHSEIKLEKDSEEKEKNKGEEDKSKEEEQKKVTSLESLERSTSAEGSIEREEEEKSPIEVSTNKEKQPNTSRDEKSSNEEKPFLKSSEKSSKEDKPFSRFFDRPYSPPENFEDAKYSDIGPRVNKPAFYHPPFPVPDYERYREKSGKSQWIASDEKDENGKYIFPWNREKINDEDSDESKHRSLESYEYPWEKRDRLAKEQKRRKRKYGFLDDDDDDEDGVSFVKKRSKYVYPWDRYDVPSKNHGNNKRHIWRSSSFDNDELSSENLPVVKHDTSYHDNNRKTSSETDLDVDLNEDSDKKTSLTDNNSKSLSTKESSFKRSFDSPDNTKIDSILSLGLDDVIVTPNRKSRRKMMQIEKSASYEIISESMEEPDRKKLTKKKSIKKLTKRRNKNNLVDSETEAKEITTQIPVTTTTIKTLVDSSGPFTRRHRKRKVVKTQSIDKPLGQPVTGPTTEPTLASTTEFSKIGRRRVRFTTQISTPSTTTTATPLVRRKQQVSNSLNKKKPRSEIADESNVSIKDNSNNATPAGRTIEHRSKVSKEKIITKTVYPNDEAAFDVGRPRKSVVGQSRQYSTGSKAKVGNSETGNRRKTDGGKQKRTTKNKSVEKISITTKKTPDRVYRNKEIDKDGLKGTFITIIPDNQTEIHASKENLNVKDDELQDKKKLKVLDQLNTSRQNTSKESETVPLPESYVIGSLMQNAIPSIADNSELKEKESDGSDESDESDESKEEDEEKWRILSRARVIKDPQRRLYYYVDRR